MEVRMKSGNEFDAIVIGAGNAGLAAAGVLRAAERSVAIIEKRDLGGTCPIRGCVPKKVLVAAAQTLDVISRAGEPDSGVSAGARLDSANRARAVLCEWRTARN
jgi:pyruvate/2-oxoglutarate dehydrogenase complex dihydrolipoamide dehydrogenase (E3) component